MLKDITIGQYFPGKSVLHRLDPRMKNFADSGLHHHAVLAYPTRWDCAWAFCFGFCLCDFGIPPRMITKSLKPVIPLLFYHCAEHVFCKRGSSV